MLSCDPRESLGARRGLSRLSAWENCVSGGGGGSPAVFAVLWQIIAKKWPAAVRTHSLCCSLIYLDLCMCDGSTSDKINLHSAGTYTLHTGIHIIWYFTHSIILSDTITCPSCHLSFDLLNKILIFWIQSSFNYTTSAILPTCVVLVCLHLCRPPGRPANAEGASSCHKSKFIHSSLSTYLHTYMQVTRLMWQRLTATVANCQ